MIYFSFALFIVYNTMLFYYSKSLYSITKNIIPDIVVTTPVNFFILFASVYITEFNNDYIIMLSFLITYTLEFKFIFKQSYLKTLFGTLSYAVNLFAMRTSILAIISIINQVPISQSAQDLDVRLLVTLITLLLRPFTLRKAMKSVGKKQIFMIFSNKDNLSFSLGILAITFAYQVCLSFLISAPTFTLNTTVYLLGTSIFSLGIYIGTMAHAYEFSKLQLHFKDYNRLANKIKKEEKKLAQLKSSADIDPFTGTYIRRVGEEKLESYVQEKKPFFLVYVDIDGLKITNDKYGHTEGDFYIKKVAEVLLDVFSSEFVSRMGGDEFLVLGKNADEYEITRNVLICLDKVKDISSNYKKQYKTSLSYGVVQVNEKNKTSAKEILSIADKKMYMFKNENRTAR